MEKGRKKQGCRNQITWGNPSSAVWPWGRDSAFRGLISGCQCQKIVLQRPLEFLESCDAFCSGLSFQGYLFSKQPWQIKTVSPLGRGQICLLSRTMKTMSPPRQGSGRFARSRFYKARGFLISGFLGCDTSPLWAQSSPGPAFYLAHETRGQRDPT